MRIDLSSIEPCSCKLGKAKDPVEQRLALQRSVLRESLEEDLYAAAVESGTKQVSVKPDSGKAHYPMPSRLPRVSRVHEPKGTQCECGGAMRRTGGDVLEILHYVPGGYQVERHVRGQWVCDACNGITKAPFPPQVIAGSPATASVLARVLVRSYAYRLQLFQQQRLYALVGLTIPRSTLAEWVATCAVKLQPLVDVLKSRLLSRSLIHADEIVMPSRPSGWRSRHCTYLRVFGTAPSDSDPMVVYEFAVGRSGERSRGFLGGWHGDLVWDELAGSNAMFRVPRPAMEVGCLAHVRERFKRLHSDHQSQLAGEALQYYDTLYSIENKAKDLGLDAAARLSLRQAESAPVAQRLHEWLTHWLSRVERRSMMEQAIWENLCLWDKLMRYLLDGAMPIDNTSLESPLRPLSVGWANGAFSGSDRASKRTAAVMSLIQTARLHGLDPSRYLQDVLERLPTTPVNQLVELLPGQLVNDESGTH